MNAPIRVTRSQRLLCGCRVYDVEQGDALLALIRFFDRKTLSDIARSDLPPHWAVLWTSGRIDRHESFGEARDNALKGPAVREAA